MMLPVEVEGIRDAEHLMSGPSGHVCVIHEHGDVASCWGVNGHGQLGSRGSDRSLVPVTVGGFAPATQLSGGLRTCAWSRGGPLQCWGDNTRGGLGDGTQEDRTGPILVPEIEGVIDAAAGTTHTCAIVEDPGRARAIRCWGDNRNGQLGDGTTEMRLSPTAPSDAPGAVRITAGEAHTCALFEDGTVRCWGSNEHGQLGDGSGEDRSAPVTLELTDVTALAAGTFHTCAVRDESEVLCWGANDSGQLSDGSDADLLAPTVVQGL